MRAIVRASNIHRILSTDRMETVALRDVSFEVRYGEFVSIVGPSGSGKSTLLSILGLMDKPDSGVYEFGGVDTSGLTSSMRARIRNEKIGFVFQSFNLLPELSALDNVALPLKFRNTYSHSQCKLMAQAALESVGMMHRSMHRPWQLSGGQQQRVALARALAGNPPLVLADEPTGNLDSESSMVVLDLLSGLCRGGATMILVTHDDEAASRADRVVRMSDGCISSMG